MRGKANYDNYKESGELELIPDGTYKFKIAEKVDKLTDNNDPMIQIKLICLDPMHNDKWVWDNIIIPNLDSPSHKIAGRTKRFLHCINEPYEGDFEWDSDRWVERTLYAKIKTEKFEDKQRNKVSAYILSDDQENKQNENNNLENSNLPF